jgi:hypothetical protein
MTIKHAFQAEGGLGLAKVICQWCREKDDRDIMVKDTKGYYHTEKGCHRKFLNDKEFKRIEREKQTKLAEKIAEVYGLENIQLIPSQFYPFLEDIRNDSKLFGRLGKAYKNGIPYEGIAYTYDYCKEKIKDARRTKVFKNFLMELRYGLAIVKNNLVDAKDHAILQRRTKDSAAIGMKKIEEEMSEVPDEVIYKSKKEKKDISKYL